MRLEGKTVLVTGANRRIGHALVEEALKRGAKRVYAATRQPLADLDERVTPLILDVTNAGQIQTAVERVDSLDILINNAGVGLYDDLSDRAALEQHLAVNLLGTYGVTRSVPLIADPLWRCHRERAVNRGCCRPASCPGLLDLQGGRFLTDSVTARPSGGRGRAGAHGPGWAYGY